MLVKLEDAEIALWFAQYVSDNSDRDGSENGFSLEEQRRTAKLAFDLATAVYVNASDLAVAGILSADALLGLAKKMQAACDLCEKARERQDLATMRRVRERSHSPSREVRRQPL